MGQQDERPLRHSRRNPEKCVVNKLPAERHPLPAAAAVIQQNRTGGVVVNTWRFRWITRHGASMTAIWTDPQREQSSRATAERSGSSAVRPFESVPVGARFSAALVRAVSSFTYENRPKSEWISEQQLLFCSENKKIQLMLIPSLLYCTSLSGP